MDASVCHLPVPAAKNKGNKAPDQISPVRNVNLLCSTKKLKRSRYVQNLSIVVQVFKNNIFIGELFE